MTKEEYLQWEEEAIKRGYKKYNTTSSNNDYSYFKTIGKNDDGFQYMIEWRVWDWRKYIDRDATVKDRPFSLEVNIIPDSGKYDMRLDMLIGEPLVFGFNRIEEIAERYYQFVKNEMFEICE
jgi:hypothetical protein